MSINRSPRLCSPENLERFRHSVPSQVSIPKAEWEYVVPHLVERRFEKDEYLVAAGDIADNFYYIIDGLVRFFYSTEDGKEFNKHFAMENDFAGSFHSLVLGARCAFFIQAMEKTNTIVLPNQLLRELYERHPCWERLGRRKRVKKSSCSIL